MHSIYLEEVAMAHKTKNKLVRTVLGIGVTSLV